MGCHRFLNNRRRAPELFSGARRRHERETRTAPPSPAPAAAPAVEDRPVRTRETASDGYRAALAAHQAHRQTPEPALDPAVQAARNQQIRNRLREPEEEFGDGQAVLAALRAKAAATTTGAGASDAARARALQRLAADRAGLTTLTPARPAAPLRDTA